MFNTPNYNYNYPWNNYNLQASAAVPQQPQPQPQPLIINPGINWIQGEAEIKNYIPAAGQTAQTAELRQSGANQLNQLVSELRSCPIPAQPVYGSQPIFTCSGNQGGCGCGGIA